MIKFGGLSAGGTERWLQMMAANLPKSRFEVDYYYCDAAPYIGSDYRHADTDPARLRYMEEHGIDLIKFTVGAKDITTPTHDWVDTNFWEVFRADKYDLVQTAKAGPAEYPYHLLKLPVVEYVTLSAGVDKSPNIACSIHLSQWQRAQWFRSGGDLSKSAVIPIPAEPPATNLDMRRELGIPRNALVAGFHQRVDEHIFSPIPLEAFAKVARLDWHFILMGGGKAYREQAQQLGMRNIHFVPHSGSSEQISRFLNSLDVFAHGRSDGETFGTVFAEAMMHGKPCLSHRSKIANAQVETMGPAGLFADGVSDYADKLSRLFSDANLRAQLAKKAKAHAEEYYSLDACVDELTRIYARVLGLEVPAAQRQRITYGQSDLGFLYAGVLDTPTSLGFHVMTGGVPEEFDVHLVRFFLPHIKCFLDVGANTGLYGFFVAKHGAADTVVHAFEPQKACCEFMEKTVWLNNWEQKVFVHPLAIGSQPGRLELHLNGTGSTLNNAFNDDIELPTEWVRVETINNLAKSLAISKIDFVRIDVEGYEQEVLEGAEQVIAKDHPVLFVELADRIRGRCYRNPNYRKTLTWLQRMGYKVLRSTENFELQEVSLNDEYDHFAMHLCLHRAFHADLVPGLRDWASDFVSQKSREEAKRRRELIRRALRNPLWAAGRVVRRVRRRFGQALRRESSLTSYRQHHSEYVRPDAVARHRTIYRTYEEQDLFNHPENRFGELLAKHPEVRGVAVDIGAGAGWLSARLSRDFERVIAIEPSGAALELAKQIYSNAMFGNIEWIQGMAQELIRNLHLNLPAFFVTGCVLSHLPDDVVMRICSAVNKVAPQGSILAFAECWGPESHEVMWHVRTQEWWRRALPGWELDFHGPHIQDVPGRHKGIHGVRIG